MADGVFQNGLQRQAQDAVFHQAVGDVDLEGKGVVIPRLHDLKVAGCDFQFPAKGNDMASFA